MRSLMYPDLLKGTGYTPDRFKLQHHRDLVALAFGQAAAFASLRYLEVDVAAVALADMLTENLPRKLAAHVVRDQWGVWMRLVAVAEHAPSNVPVLFYVVTYEGPDGKRGHLTTGSLLDCDRVENLTAIARDLRDRTGIIAKSYVAVEMRELLADIRAKAAAAGLDLSDPFLPPWGDQLEEVLKPYDDATPDRAIINVGKPQRQQTAAIRRAGVAARATVEGWTLQ